MTLIHGLDISNYQGRDNAVPLAQQFHASHVVVRASLEMPTLRWTARKQMVDLLDAGYAVDPYHWVYWSDDPVNAMRDSLDAYSALVRPHPIWWLDVEDEGHGADLANVGKQHEWLARAVDHLEASGWRAGIYTSESKWQTICGDTDGFARLPLWDARYDRLHTLGDPGYGGWTMQAGHQYTSDPTDLNVFDMDTLYPTAACPEATMYRALLDRLRVIIQRQKTVRTSRLAREI